LTRSKRIWLRMQNRAGLSATPCSAIGQLCNL
jgi:hypothetical protein